MTTLEQLRERINAVDSQIVKLLAERVKIALALGYEKKRLGKEVYDPEREEVVMRGIRNLAVAEGLNPEDVEPIYRGIITVARRAQHDNT